MTAGKYPYAKGLGLQPLLGPLKPLELTKPSNPRVGRPKALADESLSKFLRTEGPNSKRRYLGQLLKAIAEINSKIKIMTPICALLAN
jgi:hypothetical protein